MRKSLPIAVCLAALFVSPAQADPILFNAVLRGVNENPANSSSGVGVAVIGYDSATHDLSVVASYAGLTAPVIAAHIHCCVDPPGNAGVATTVPSFPGFPTGTFGNYMQTFNLTDAGSFNPAFVTAAGGLLAAELALVQGLQQGQAYFNIHTTAFPGGEIRGFLTALSDGNGPGVIPEPATMLLVGGGLGALVLRRRKWSAKRGSPAAR